jgi:hypothetical protein
MNDEMALFAILGLVYVTDCFYWIDSNTVAFVSGPRGRWVQKVASDLIRTAKGGLLMINPLPPLGGIFCCHPLPISVAPEAISFSSLSASSIRETRSDWVTVPLDGRHVIEARGSDLIVDGKRLSRCKDSQQVNKVCDLLKLLQEAALEKRAFLIDRFWQEQFDLASARNRFEAATAPLRELRILCNGLFLVLFLLAPSIVLYAGRVSMLIPIGLGMLVVALWIAIRFNALFRRCFPGATDDRVTHLIKMVLCPPAAIRACDHITQSLLSDFHPFVVARLILSPERYGAFAAQTLRCLRFPIVPPHEGGYAGPATWQSETLLRKALDFLRETGLSEAELLAPPAPDGPGVSGYCPRCLEQFTEAEGECPDCPGVQLVSFSEVPYFHETKG